MAEIVVPMREMKRLITEGDVTPFESGDTVAIPYGHHLVKAYKSRPAKIFKSSIVMEAIGYSGVAHSWMRNFAGLRHPNDV